MSTYRKKTVEIEAWDVADLIHAAGHDWKALPKQVADAYERGEILFLNTSIVVLTLEGRMTADRADKLICGVQGELYPCKPDIFAATYDAEEPTV